MNKEQFKKWKEFSLRMAKTYPRITSLRREKLTRNIEQYFIAIASESQKLKQAEEWEDLPSNYFSEFFERFYVPSDREKESSFQSQLHCCIRAGVDIAVSGNVGVLGWTSGDIQNMFPDGIPDWVKERFTQSAFDKAENILPL